MTCNHTTKTMNLDCPHCKDWSFFGMVGRVCPHCLKPVKSAKTPQKPLGEPATIHPGSQNALAGLPEGKEGPSSEIHPANLSGWDMERDVEFRSLASKEASGTATIAEIRRLEELDAFRGHCIRLAYIHAGLPYPKFTLGDREWDIYDLANASGVTSHPLFNAFKKIIRLGRGEKTAEQDLKEAIRSIQRHLDGMPSIATLPQDTVGLPPDAQDVINENFHELLL